MPYGSGILEGPYIPTTVIIPTVPATDNSPKVPKQTTVETVLNIPLMTCGKLSKGYNKYVDTTPRYKNDNQTGQFGNQRTMTVAGARETVGKKWLLCKLAVKGVHFQAEQSDWLADTDEEIDEQELEAHYSYMAKIQEVLIMRLGMICKPIRKQNDSFVFVHEFKKEMHADLKYVESLKNEIDELKSDKADFSNMYDMLLQECVSNDVMCSYLHSLSDLDAHSELQCLYLHKVKECECLAQKLSKQTESVNKEVYTELLRSFAKLEKHSISIKLALQQCQEQMKNNTVCKEKASNVFQKNSVNKILDLTKI
ncbi:hypothetical protein Tco_0982417 [Tanacetum coccineum]